MGETKLLRLAAFDAEDLAVISAQTQDGLAHIGDMLYQPKAQEFALVLWRFDWSAALRKQKIRRASLLRFRYVRAVHHIGLAQKPKDFVLNLLATTFTASDAPSGQVRLDFSEQIAIALDVECLECALHDFDDVFRARFRPRHLGYGV